MTDLTPQTIKGKEFEDILLHRARMYDEPAKRYCLNRYGVMGSFVAGEWRPIESLPDFDMVLPDGRQCCFDAKVCSQASYSLSGGTSKSFTHQYRFMQRKARFNVLSFLLMHFNGRKLKKTEEPAFTILFPVGLTAFWQAYDAGEMKSMSRQQAQQYGLTVNWTLPTERCTNASPDLLEAVTRYRARLTSGEVT